MECREGGTGHEHQRENHNETFAHHWILPPKILMVGFPGWYFDVRQAESRRGCLLSASRPVGFASQDQRFVHLGI
jgi:hypothetical protein